MKASARSSYKPPVSIASAGHTQKKDFVLKATETDYGLVNKSVRNTLARSGTGGTTAGKLLIPKPNSGAFSSIKAQMNQNGGANLNLTRVSQPSVSQSRVET